MDTSIYLLALYVTQEQEAAIQSLFFAKQWMFCKTDAESLVTPKKVVYQFESLDCNIPVIKTEPDVRQKTLTLYGDLDADEPTLISHRKTISNHAEDKSEPVSLNDDLYNVSTLKCPDVKLRECSVSLKRVSVPITGYIKIEPNDSTPESSPKRKGRAQKHLTTSTSSATPAKESSTSPEEKLTPAKESFIPVKKKLIPDRKSLTPLKKSLTPAKQLKKNTEAKKNINIRIKSTNENTLLIKSKTSNVSTCSDNQTVNTFKATEEANVPNQLDKHETETVCLSQDFTDSKIADLKIADEIIKEDDLNQIDTDDNDNYDNDNYDDEDYDVKIDIGNDNEDYHIDDNDMTTDDGEVDDDNVDGVMAKDPDYGKKIKKKGKKKVKKILKCDKCNKTYKNETSFQTHQSSDCGKKKVKKRKVVEDSGTGSFRCETCKKVFTYKRKYLKHFIDGVCDRKCKYCGKVCCKTLKRHIFYKHEMEVERLRCEICNKRIYDKADLTEHMQSHNESKDFICDQCGQAFQKQIHLYIHSKRFHEETTSHECDICHKMLSSASGLLYHKRVTHSDVRDCVCEICGKRFKTARCVRTHMKMHSDAKPYHCDVCNKDYKYCHQLYSHKRIYHRHIQRYFCAVCGKGYYFEHLLKDHMNLHNGIKAHSCLQCDYTSYTRVQMTQHRRKHRIPKTVETELIPETEETIAVSTLTQNLLVDSLFQVHDV
ncbi:hypothetical protein ACF0H5_002965 [Mactra antiquata]